MTHVIKIFINIVTSQISEYHSPFVSPPGTWQLTYSSQNVQIKRKQTCNKDHIQHRNKKAQFCLFRKTAGFLFLKYFFLLGNLVEIENSSLRKFNYIKRMFSNVDHFISTHKALNHEPFCKQQHYHKLRLTNHCWFKWQPFLATGQSARQECCSTQATSGLSVVLQSFRSLSLAETMPQLPDGWASFILIPPTCATTNTCAQKPRSAEFADEVQRLKMGILVKISL